MSDDLVRILIEKIDKTNDAIAEIKTDIAVLKTQKIEKEKRCEVHNEEIKEAREDNKQLDKRVVTLEESKTQFLGAKGIIAWLFTTVVALIGAFKDHLFK